MTAIMFTVSYMHLPINLSSVNNIRISTGRQLTRLVIAKILDKPTTITDNLNKYT